MTCILCDSGSSTPLECFPHAHVCDGCGFVYVPERRSAEEIAADWKTVYEEGGYDPQWPGVQARLYYVANWLDWNFGLDQRKVFDIGAGDGSFLQFCAGHGATTFGCEPTVKESETVFGRSWEKLDSLRGEQRYHYATMNWTLENCGDPLGMLEFADDIAERVVVATGSRILVPYKKPIACYFGPYEPDLHSWRWSYETLKLAFWKIGLVVDDSNDFRMRDEMIVVGKRGLSEKPKGDDPEDVHRFFYGWAKYG